jgi:2-oxoglutarate dehydrogenase E2 component (dihydrolipoamide succinyltransferase)
MAIELKIPALGESVTQATLVKWHKQDGERVERDEAVCELETDKANVDLPAPEAGVLRRTRAEGDAVKVGEVVGEIDPAGAANPAPAVKTAPEQAKTAATPAKPVAAKAAGAAPATAKPSAARPAVAAMRQPLAPPSPGANTIPSGTPTPGRPNEMPPIDESEAAAPNQKLTGGDPFEEARKRAADVTPHPSPAARRIIEEQRLTAVAGTGKGGRITKEDALHAGAATVASPEETPEPLQEEGVRREPMSRIRRKIAERLVAAQHTAAILTTFNEVDMSAVQAMRARYKDRFTEVHGIGLGLMSFFVRATVLALQEFPRLNAFVEGDDVVYHDFVHMGIAVSTERGLAVPVLRNAQNLSFAGIESEIKRLATSARDGKLALSELSGGTFSITNGGIFGSLLSTPIINPPQSGILGMHAIQKRPIAVDDRVEVRPMMYVALSYDHRLVDGRESVSFLVRLKQYLEDPARLMLGV